MLNEDAVRAAKELAKVAWATDEKIAIVACGDAPDAKRSPAVHLEDCFVVIVVRGDSKFWNDAQSLAKKMQPLDEHSIRVYP